MTKNDRMSVFESKSKSDRIKIFKDKLCIAFPTNISSVARRLDEMGFFDLPASLSQHHSMYNGGLFDHSECVTTCLVYLTEKLDLYWQMKRSPYVIGMFHDLCKCDAPEPCPPGEDKALWEYNHAPIMTGHGEKSVIMTQKFLRLTDEEIACIRWHKGAFDDKSMWNSFGRACNMYPNVLFTHVADMIAARICQI